MIPLSRVLAGVAVLAGLAAGTARAAEPDKLIPDKADTVVSIDLKQLLASEFVKQYALDEITKGLERQETKQFLTDIGLDPLKDIERIVVAAVDTQFKPGAEQSFLVVVRGTFNAEKLFKRAEAETKNSPDKFAMVKDGSTVMFKYQPDNGQPPVYATVIDDKTLVAASEKKLIANAIKAADTGKAAPLKKELADLIKKADSKASIYVATLTSGKLGDLNIPKQAGPVKLEAIGNALPGTESALIVVKVTSDVSLEITLGMKDADAAADMQNGVSDLLEQVKPLAKLAAVAEPQAKPLPDLLDAIKVTAKNKDVVVTIKAAGKDLGSMMQIRQARQKKKE